MSAASCGQCVIYKKWLHVVNSSLHDKNDGFRPQKSNEKSPHFFPNDEFCLSDVVLVKILDSFMDELNRNRNSSRLR